MLDEGSGKIAAASEANNKKQVEGVSRVGGFGVG